MSYFVFSTKADVYLELVSYYMDAGACTRVAGAINVLHGSPDTCGYRYPQVSCNVSSY